MVDYLSTAKKFRVEQDAAVFAKAEDALLQARILLAEGLLFKALKKQSEVPLKELQSDLQRQMVRIVVVALHQRVKTNCYREKHFTRT